MKKKIVVFATSFQDELLTHPEGEGEPARQLRQAAEGNSLELDFRCDRNPGTPPSAEELKAVVALIADLEKWDRRLLEQVGQAKGGDLGLLARYGIGYNSIDITAAREAGVHVTNTPGASSQPTAEWAVSTLLDVAGRRIPHHSRAGGGLTKSGPSRLDISGKTLGIIGTGNIGRQVAAMLSGFGLKLLAADLYPNHEWARAHGVEYTDIGSLCEQADFITLHASGGSRLIEAAEIARMHPTTVLVNCARGVLVDNRAVYEAVRDGRIYGYGIDEVWEHWDMPLTSDLNITASPHVGSDTDLGKLRMQQLSAQAVIDYIDGREPQYIVNKES
ncbi:MAG: NAD(P)-dependent oxidoreductase [Spirochaetia bacterium]|nr:NAD(P)-dependent oxidoreductase [Spirochaetia bacterium]